MVKVDLLEYLQLECNCEYLSDLKYTSHWKEKLYTMKHPEQFTMDEWNRALEYLAEIPSDFQSLREVNEYLKSAEQKGGGSVKDKRKI